jgi:hypothetical protein
MELKKDIPIMYRRERAKKHRSCCCCTTTIAPGELCIKSVYGSNHVTCFALYMRELMGKEPMVSITDEEFDEWMQSRVASQI